MTGWKKVIGVLAGIFLVQMLVSCDDSSDSPVQADSSVERMEQDDSLNPVDTIHVVDTVLVVDSQQVYIGSFVVDSESVVDRVRLVDSTRVLDSVVVDDSVYVTDSVRVLDSVVVRDSVAIRDVEYYLGECSAEIADTMMSAIVNGEERFFVCDGRTFLWREPSDADWIGLYVRKSDVKEFVPLESVVENLADGEKLVVMLRHAERGDDYSTTGPLNSNGIQQSMTLGEKLQGDLEFYYAGSPATRTHQTCNNIAKARGEADTLADTIENLGGTWFVKDTVVYNNYKNEHSGSWNVTSKWLFENSYADAFYNLAPRCVEYMEEVLFPALENSGKRVGMFISHDLVLLPLVVYISQRNIDMKYYSSSSKRWLNYLAGMAIVIKPDGSLVFYAVKGLDSGTMKG